MLQLRSRSADCEVEVVYQWWMINNGEACAPNLDPVESDMSLCAAAVREPLVAIPNVVPLAIKHILVIDIENHIVIAYG